jgi:hypothetical protein
VKVTVLVFDSKSSWPGQSSPECLSSWTGSCCLLRVKKSVFDRLILAKHHMALKPSLAGMWAMNSIYWKFATHTYGRLIGKHQDQTSCTATTRLVATRSTSTLPCAASTRLPAAAALRLLRLAQARRRLLRLRRASGCLGTSRGSSSTTPPRAGSSSTTSPMPRVRVPRHVARLVVDYFASRRLLVDYFAYVVQPSASAHRVAHHVARRQLLRLRRAYGFLGTSHGSSHCSSTTTSTMPPVWVPRHVARLIAPLVVDYFAYDARLGASTRRAARHASRCRLLRAPRLHLAATLALLQPCRASRLLVSR